MVSAPRPPDAWLGSAPPPQRVRRLLAGRSGRAPGARVPKKSRFSPVSGLSVDCGGILPCVAGPCFKRRMTHLAAAPRPPRVPAAAGAAVRRCAGPGQQSRKSPDSVRFLRYLQIAEVFFRPSPGLLASAPCFHLEIRAAPDSDPGSLSLVGDHNGIAGRIQSRAQIWRHRGLGGNYWQPDHPFFRFVVE